MKTIRTAFFLLTFFQLDCRCTIVEDHTHNSRVLGSTRNYRIFLPPEYYQSQKRYPVIYWFHGSGGSSAQVTYKTEFEDFVNNHELIIVNVDGTTASGSTWDYGLAFEYNSRTQEGKAAMTGMQFSKYIRELIGVIDSAYRTIADRDHRAVSGQSMGGLMSPWIASQNKDLIGSASMFSPSPDAAMFGPVGKEVCFVNRELYRSLKGLPLRITVAAGDRYRQYYQEQNSVWNLADLNCFEYYQVDYPDHRAVGIPDQFNFHMDEFSRKHSIPQNWHHADPFSCFRVWNTEVNVQRNPAAFTIMEKVTPSGMLVCSRPYLPNGPLIQTEKISVLTDTVFSGSQYYILTDYNRSTGIIQKSRKQADIKGRMRIDLEGGGHALGIRTGNQGAKLFLIPSDNREEIYCEDGHEYTLDLVLVNVGTRSSGSIRIRAYTPGSYVTLAGNTLDLESIEAGQKAEIKKCFPFRGHYNKNDFSETEPVTRISFEVTACDSIQDILNLFIYPCPKTPDLSNDSDLLVLDGASREVEFYDNREHKIKLQTLSGGSGNGNSIPEPGETVELYMRLARGMGPADLNTWHPAYLLNPEETGWTGVPQLTYNIKGAEYSGAANLQSRILIREDIPPGTRLSLWLKCESYEFSEEGYNRPVQRHQYDYRKVNLSVGMER